VEAPGFFLETIPIIKKNLDNLRREGIVKNRNGNVPIVFMRILEEKYEANS